MQAVINHMYEVADKICMAVYMHSLTSGLHWTNRGTYKSICCFCAEIIVKYPGIAKMHRQMIKIVVSLYILCTLGYPSVISTILSIVQGRRNASNLQLFTMLYD